MKNYLLSILILGILLSCSCQKEHVEAIIPLSKYQFKIPGKLHFDFTQQKRLPSGYCFNQLEIKNVSAGALKAEYAIYAFNDEILKYSNLAFIYSDKIQELQKGEKSALNLENSNSPFSAKNCLVSVLEMGGVKHQFSGVLVGEAELSKTIMRKTEEESPQKKEKNKSKKSKGGTASNKVESTEKSTESFERSIMLTGCIDYRGRLFLISEDQHENEYVTFVGKFDSTGRFIGEIYKADGVTLIDNVTSDEVFIYADNDQKLTGKIKFTLNEESEEPEEIELGFKLNRQQ